MRQLQVFEQQTSFTFDQEIKNRNFPTVDSEL